MLVFYLLLVNLFTFFLFAEDKETGKKRHVADTWNAPLYCLHYSAVQSGRLPECMYSGIRRRNGNFGSVYR